VGWWDPFGAAVVAFSGCRVGGSVTCADTRRVDPKAQVRCAFVGRLSAFPSPLKLGATSPAARYGTMSTGDIIDSQVLVSKTADGVDLGSLWDEFTELLDVYTTTPPSSATC
jgi:hypothetical protein